MNIFKSVSMISAGAILIAASTSAFAGSVYSVSDTAEVNCTTRGNDAPHGLWTNRYRQGKGGCRQFYSFQEGSSLSVSDDAATFKATAINPDNVVAEIDFTFEQPTSKGDWDGVVKTGGAANSSDWTFYQAGHGSIDITYDREFGNWTYRVIDKFTLDLVDNTSFQFGLGANDKTSAFGASAWLDIESWTRNTVILRFDDIKKSWEHAVAPWAFDWRLGDHWDFNMELSAVPLPAAAWLFITGLMGLFGFRRFTRPGTPAS